MMSTCKNCGGELPANAVLCPQCGCAVEQTSITTAHYDQDLQKDMDEANRERKQKKDKALWRGRLRVASYVVFVSLAVLIFVPLVLEHGGGPAFQVAWIAHTPPIALLAIGQLCFFRNYLNPGYDDTPKVLSVVWTVAYCVSLTSVRYTLMGFNKTSAYNAWWFFAIMLSMFASVIIACANAGRGLGTSDHASKGAVRASWIVFLAVSLLLPMCYNVGAFSAIGLPPWIAYPAICIIAIGQLCFVVKGHSLSVPGGSGFTRSWAFMISAFSFFAFAFSLNSPLYSSSLIMKLAYFAVLLVLFFVVIKIADGFGRSKQK